MSAASVAPTALERFSAVFPGLTPGANLCRAYGAGAAASFDLALGRLLGQAGAEVWNRDRCHQPQYSVAAKTVNVAVDCFAAGRDSGVTDAALVIEWAFGLQRPAVAWDASFFLQWVFEHSLVCHRTRAFERATCQGRCPPRASLVSVAPTALGRFSAVFPGLTPGANLCRAYGADAAASFDLAAGGTGRGRDIREVPACGRQASLRSLRKVTQGRRDDNAKRGRTRQERSLPAAGRPRRRAKEARLWRFGANSVGSSAETG